MKQILSLCLFLLSINICAQDAEKYAVQKTIEAFFEGFHLQDSVAIKETVVKEVILQTLSKDSLGKHYVRTEDFSKFIKNIVSISETTKFQETIKSYSIQVDGPMANAWTAYEFHVNDKFSHCGVNSFQLVKQEDAWKIIYLIDTRRKEGCE
ncbi:nuclear transport factor 2 family protein [Maribacter algarum]|uniref:Nuclear transport factor 2 family protein n=1 Tax=Maribacter algarum (ex Zhang et al. 2020) TaxID=2578118 RepID=A0A5S3PSS8_9FLAO|nr:nuclear transport factor 2 family protein [Maribacter algarum]TMM56963.1 nuclear transport factor 2 family protein [Maribacter algarum]